ncbi:uncharacterized protein N7483_000974 [Penicillium malachiteum]|uniref:uncharacterized protein n=1 Tax=Penicillium malachiteum TaxID=1324776 RepID=UPI002546F793|nr:uncharacterized protein N7483_000974 [Penicillium malachiteum]KAJ5735849.1 hypothetical protein N7483_000974 [Penicillium malachiteum]
MGSVVLYSCVEVLPISKPQESQQQSFSELSSAIHCDMPLKILTPNCSRVLVNSTLLLTAPALPFYPLSGSIQNILDTETSDNQILMETTTISSVACNHPNISLDMKCTFFELAAYTRSIESYVRGDTLRLDAQMMCDRRNLAQYNLMSIPSTSGRHHENALSEICRIAAIIYSIGVTFPLAGVGAPFPKLVQLLQSELKNSEILESDPQVSTTNQVLLWVLTMGGIASIEKSERKWYATALVEVMTRCQLSEWTDMRNSLKEILWLDSACNMAGKELWKETHSIMQQQLEQEKVAM